MTKNTTLYIAIVALIIAIVAILAVSKVITLPWTWGA